MNPADFDNYVDTADLGGTWDLVEINGSIVLDFGGGVGGSQAIKIHMPGVQYLGVTDAFRSIPVVAGRTYTFTADLKTDFDPVSGSGNPVGIGRSAGHTAVFATFADNTYNGAFKSISHVWTAISSGTQELLLGFLYGNGDILNKNAWFDNLSPALSEQDQPRRAALNLAAQRS